MMWRRLTVFAAAAVALASCAGTTTTGRQAVVPHARASHPAAHPQRITDAAAGDVKPVLAPRAASDGPGHKAQPEDGPIWQRVHSMTLLNKVRQLMVLPFGGTGVPYRTIDALHPGGLIYFSNNLTSQAQTKSLS